MVGGNNDRRAERNEITMKWLRAEVALGGLNEIHGDLILDKLFFAPYPHDAANVRQQIGVDLARRKTRATQAA